MSDVILQSDEDDDEASQPPKVITRGQANDCINKLREFFQSKSYQVDDQLQKLSDWKQRSRWCTQTSRLRSSIFSKINFFQI